MKKNQLKTNSNMNTTVVHIIYRSCAKHITVFSNQLKTNLLVLIHIQTQPTVQYKASLQSAFDNKKRLRRQN